MLKYNLSKILKKKLFHFIKWEVGIYTWKKCIVPLVYSKTQIYSKKQINDF
jgi:hypothetical protein